YGTFKTINYLKLDDNKLEGPIPAEIGSLGRLKNFNVANNISAKLVTPRQGLSSSTNVATILIGFSYTLTNNYKLVAGSSTLSPNKFANLDGEDISEEGEEEEEEMLDYCFANAAMNADISPRQQRNEAWKKAYIVGMVK
ncbi:hypothetical protein H5410_035107, partial [Solanum commersonii]